MTEVEKQRERDDAVSRMKTLATVWSHGLILDIVRRPERDIEGMHVGIAVYVSAKFSGKETVDEINLSWELFEQPHQAAREIIHNCNLKPARPASENPRREP